MNIGSVAAHQLTVTHTQCPLLSSLFFRGGTPARVCFIFMWLNYWCIHILLFLLCFSALPLCVGVGVCVCACVHTCSLSRVPVFTTHQHCSPWTIAHWASPVHGIFQARIAWEVNKLTLRFLCCWYWGHLIIVSLFPYSLWNQPKSLDGMSFICLDLRLLF